MTHRFALKWVLVVASIGWFGGAAKAQDFATLDIAVLLDSSGSVQSAGWATEIAFLNDYVDTSRPVNSRLAFTQFATSVTRQHEFTDDQSAAALHATLDSLVFTTGWGHLRDALVDTMALFNEQSHPTLHDKLIIIITDGTPNPVPAQLPCDLASTLSSAGIHTIIVGVGSGWTPDIIACLVADTVQDISFVDDVSGEFLNFDRFRNIAVPAVSEWGLILTALLVASAGTIMLTRRRSPAV